MYTSDMLLNKAIERRKNLTHFEVRLDAEIQKNVDLDWLAIHLPAGEEDNLTIDTLLKISILAMKIEKNTF